MWKSFNHHLSVLRFSWWCRRPITAWGPIRSCQLPAYRQWCAQFLRRLQQSKQSTLIVWVTSDSSAKLTVQRCHRSAFDMIFRCLYTDCLMLLRGGIKEFILQLQLYTLILRWVRAGIKKWWLLCGIVSLHWILNWRRAAFVILFGSCEKSNWCCFLSVFL